MKTQHSKDFPPRRFYSFYCPCCRVVIFMEKRTVRKLVTDPTLSFYFQLISGMWIPLSYQGLPETEAFIDLVNEIMPPLKKGYTK